MSRLTLRRSHQTGKLARRRFLQLTGIGGAALTSGPFLWVVKGSDQIVRGHDRPAGAVIGLGNRGKGMAEWQMPPYADVLAICDVDLRKMGPVAEEIEKRTGRKVEVYQDYRRILDRKDIDIIANCTPEHWHTKINIDACRSGKDVYCEKPLTLTVAEGQLLRKVMQETGRIIQVGTQQRSGPQFQIVCSLVRGGRIGELKQIGVILPGRGFGGPRNPAVEAPVPEGLDWDMWSGQAPLHPFSPDRVINSGRWSDYGGGLVTAWGPHHMDIAHWAMGGEEVGPMCVEAEGYSPYFGKPNYPDEFVPFAARLEYPNGVEMWFFSSYAAISSAEYVPFAAEIKRIYGRIPDRIKTFQTQDPDEGVLFLGTKGWMFVGRARADGEGIGELRDMPLPPTRHLCWRACLYAHMFNFVTCVNTRHKPLSDAAEQHRTMIPCHLTNIAMRLGRKLRWDPLREEFIDDDEANALLSRPQREPYRLES